MTTRDLVLRLCASTTEFSPAWLDDDGKSVVALPSADPAGQAVAQAVAGAANSLGAPHLLVCRTRPDFMYEPVAVIPATAGELLEVVRGWGEPADFCVCLPDREAAVLVNTAGFVVAAGPVPFLRALAGPDVGAARIRFAAWAARSGDPVVRAAGARYGPAPPPNRRQPAADLAGWLAAVAEATRRRPVLTAALRLLRSGLAWAALAAIVVTLLSAPGAPRVLPVFAGFGWLMLAVFALARSHTLAWSAYLRFAAAGVLAAAAVATVAALAGGAASVLGVIRGPLSIYSGVVEEGVKLLPLLVFWVAARHRAGRLAAADFVLIGVASGAGFQLAEDTVRVLTGVAPGHYAPAAILPGWAEAGPAVFPGHAVTTGLLAGVIGLVATRGGRRTWYRWPLVPLLAGLAVVDHVHYNAVVLGLDLPPALATAHAALGSGHATRWLLLGLLLLAVVADYRAARAVDDVVPPLPGVPRWASLERSLRASAGRVRAAAGRRAGGGGVRTAGVGERVAARSAGAAMRVVVVLAEAAGRMAHELVVLALAVRARPGTGTFPAALRFVRERRELAMAAVRPGGEQAAAGRRGLWRLAERLRAALVPLAWAGPAALVLAVVAPAVPGTGTGRAPAVMAERLPALETWYDQFIVAGQWLVAGAAVSVVALLLTTWSTPVVELVRGAGVPDTGTGTGTGTGEGRLPVLLRDLTPGRIAVGLPRLLGLALPAGLERLLRPEPVTPAAVLEGTASRPPGRVPGRAAIPGRAARALSAPTVHDEPSAAAVAAAYGLKPATDVLVSRGRGTAGGERGDDRDVRDPRHLRDHRDRHDSPHTGDTRHHGTGDPRDTGAGGPVDPLPPRVVALPGPAPQPPPGAAMPARGRRPARGGWLFPADRVRQCLLHAPDFDVVTGTSFDVAAFTAALRQVADDPGALRLDEVTYRDRPATAVIELAGARVVLFTPAGEFTGCGRLTEDQLYRLIRDRRL